jgi:glutamate formiminotransferase/formiminotetrahydrofolate cyclodeaminase
MAPDRIYALSASPLIECIPNFSEGRRPDVIATIVDAIRGAAPVRILDTSSDADHNRTVVTFVGAPDAVEAAAFAGIRTAAQLIDMESHRGEHPRLGATDVVPFVPLRDATIADCVAIAKRLGERVGNELGIPVYLYEDAANRPDRKNLEDVRRGEYEALKTAIGTDPNRQPDFGPVLLDKAGATIIGARAALIAFNVYLTTPDVQVAKHIAKAVRQSSGGLRYVKASGFLVEGRAQVSMNLTNFEQTPIFRAVELIRREAQRYGVGIAFTELIGLAPEAALIDSARWYLQLDRFAPDQLLERRVQQTDQPISTTAKQAGAALTSEFVGTVASGAPTPGGGAVAALAGALGAALAEMVAQLTVGRKKYAEVEEDMQAIIAQATELRGKLLTGIDQDMGAYDSVMRAFKIPKDDPTRDTGIQQALTIAAEVPLLIMNDALAAMMLASSVAALGNINAISDAAVSAHMALAAIESAALNVRINAKSMTNATQSEHFRNKSLEIVQAAHKLHAQIISQVETRAGI